MAVVKRAVFLLLLLAVSAYADHHVGLGNITNHQGYQREPGDHADCENLNKALHSKDLHKSFGNWVLVSLVANQSEALDYFRNLSSSHIELRLLDDNKTITFKEWNKYNDGSCANYFMKTSLAENRADHDHHILTIDGYHLEKNGTVERQNENGEFQFYQNSEYSLRTVFRGEQHTFLLNYVREGHHRNVTQLREHDAHHDRQAKCLGFSHEETLRYEGVEEPCHKETPQAFKDHLAQRGNHGGSDPNDQEQ